MTVEGARLLAQRGGGSEQFVWWALTLVDARPLGGSEKHGCDPGIHGGIPFTVGGRNEMGQALVTVTSGPVDRAAIRSVRERIVREQAEIGIFLTLEEPTSDMRHEAAAAGFYISPISGKHYQAIQILSVRELLEQHRKPMLPPLLLPIYEQAERADAGARMQTDRP
jgi:site-specific DNA-methyltransferase (adenine-specific)